MNLYNLLTSFICKYTIAYYFVRTDSAYIPGGSSTVNVASSSPSKKTRSLLGHSKLGRY